MVSDSSHRQNRRHFYRLVYLPDHFPTIEIAGKKYEILDISENGLRFQTPVFVKFGAIIRGTIRFLSDVTIEFKGRIIWRMDNEYGLFLNEPIAHSIFEKEAQEKGAIKDE